MRTCPRCHTVHGHQRLAFCQPCAEFLLTQKRLDRAIDVRKLHSSHRTGSGNRDEWMLDSRFPESAPKHRGVNFRPNEPDGFAAIKSGRPGRDKRKKRSKR